MRILAVKTEAVTIGVLDKDVSHEPDLIEVTYLDDNNVPHTVFGHRNGPFNTPEAIVAAHQDGTLHGEPTPQPVPEEVRPPQGFAFE